MLTVGLMTKIQMDENAPIGSELTFNSKRIVLESFCPLSHVFLRCLNHLTLGRETQFLDERIVMVINVSIVVHTIGRQDIDIC